MVVATRLLLANSVTYHDSSTLVPIFTNAKLISALPSYVFVMGT